MEENLYNICPANLNKKIKSKSFKLIFYSTAVPPLKNQLLFYKDIQKWTQYSKTLDGWSDERTFSCNSMGDDLSHRVILAPALQI